MTLPFRTRLAVRIAGWIGGDYYKRMVLRISELAKTSLDAIDLVPTLEDKCVWYLVESHHTPDKMEKMDALLCIQMIMRYQE